MSDDYHNVQKASRNISHMYPIAASRFPKDLYIKVFTMYEMLRIADNIEDSPISEKKLLLEAHTESLIKKSPNPRIKNIISKFAKNHQELAVATYYDFFFEQFQKLPNITQSTIVDTVRKMIPGMYEEKYTHIGTFKEQEEYAGYVAGEVGIGLSSIFHEYIDFKGPYQNALALGWKTGVSWQKVNILRGVCKDSNQNRSYLPSEILAKYSISHESFRSNTAFENLDAKIHALNEIILDAEKWLKYDIDYLQTIPVLYDSRKPYSVGIRHFVGGISLLLSKITHNMHDNPLIFQRECKPNYFTLLKSAMFICNAWDDNSRIEKKFEKNLKN